MPYIMEQRRKEIAEWPASGALETTGELNYILTELMCAYVREKGLRYATLNDVVGAVEGAKAEFQRRVVAPYEDKMKTRNGDVYTSILKEI